MSAGDAAGHIDAHRNCESPPDMNGEDASRGAAAKHHLRNHSDAEDDEHECSKKFRCGLAGERLRRERWLVKICGHRLSRCIRHKSEFVAQLECMCSRKALG